MESSSVDILTTIARSLVVANAYSSLEEALEGLALAEVKRKIGYYRRRIHALERKHETDFERFTIRIKGQATPEEEDDWFAWRSARSMLSDWEDAQQGLMHARPR